MNSNTHSSEIREAEKRNINNQRLTPRQKDLLGINSPPQIRPPAPETLPLPRFMMGRKKKKSKKSKKSKKHKKLKKPKSKGMKRRKTKRSRK